MSRVAPWATKKSCLNSWHAITEVEPLAAGDR
jgi:hypothetical protein